MCGLGRIGINDLPQKSFVKGSVEGTVLGPGKCKAPSQNEDLFWGLRGGGGNLGVCRLFNRKITRFSRLSKSPPHTHLHVA
jgi:hypothetical protein